MALSSLEHFSPLFLWVLILPHFLFFPFLEFPLDLCWDFPFYSIYFLTFLSFFSSCFWSILGNLLKLLFVFPTFLQICSIYYSTCALTGKIYYQTKLPSIENKWTVALHISKSQPYKESWLRKASQKTQRVLILLLLFSDRHLVNLTYVVRLERRARE